MQVRRIALLLNREVLEKNLVWLDPLRCASDLSGLAQYGSFLSRFIDVSGSCYRLVKYGFALWMGLFKGRFSIGLCGSVSICDFQRTRGAEFLVYSHDSKDQLSVNIIPDPAVQAFHQEQVVRARSRIDGLDDEFVRIMESLGGVIILQQMTVFLWLSFIMLLFGNCLDVSYMSQIYH